ncbi:RICIN B-LIKE LECTIN EULS3 [Salix koriyanagi]|uniref:RICIN B-LIKE LECTIN EULS3 n=1 Tax=Salix koriyanagi TaxID=2511006 RepID=A0A9Q0S9W4_9ROSI|nr:RICIN B-LIKE LECTIN EULS3 [Salix koriyanagi]
MEFPHGHHSHTRHDRRNDDEEERREHYPPPPSFHQPPPSFHQPPPYYGENELEPSPPSSHYYQEPPQPPRPYFQEANYAPLPPSPFQETQVVRTFYHQVGDHSIDYPPPQTQVNHVSHEKIEIHLSFKPRQPYSIHQHAHQSGSASGIDLYSNFKVYCKAKTDFHLTIRDGKVILARSNPSDEFQNWFKDEKYSTRVKDSKGCPAFALVNKATGQAMKHSIGEAHPVQLIPYNPDVLDESILWTEGKDRGNGFRSVRMVNNIHLNVDAFRGNMKSGGVRDGTTIGLWKWNEGDNQLWKTIPLETPMEFPHGQHSHTRHDRRNDDEEERREHYPPPPSFHQPPPSFHQPPPYYGDHSIDYPPPQTQVNHVSLEKIDIHLSFKPRLPYSIHQHAHQSGSASGIDLYSNFKVYCKAKTYFHLTIRDGKVILAPSNPYDEFQNWFKDEKYSTRVKDSNGCPAFALVNKATGQAMKHSIGEAHPVQLIPYNPDVLDESILWTEGKDRGNGFRSVITNYGRSFQLSSEIMPDGVAVS